MLAALLLLGLVAAPLSSIAMFAVPGSHFAADGPLAAARRLGAAIAVTVVIGAGCALVPYAMGWTRGQCLAAAAIFVAASLVWLPLTRRWSGLAHVCWVACGFLYVAYLVFIFDWTLRSHLGAGGTIGGVVLWVLEIVAGIFSAAYLWELCDAIGTRRWRRRITRTTPRPSASDYAPFVSLHVPAHNEPADMVIETLASLCRIDYPAFEIIAIDDNTDDEQLWRPVERWCAEHGVKFAHLSDWPGYKSGALNFALQSLTDPRAEVVGVVDSDYQIAPGFLRACAPLFADPSIAFVQAPQDYRDWRQSAYYRRLYYSYKYFFAVSQPARNEHDAAIFAGTMGLIRRSVLQRLGGWNEWCITEDAELSLRLLRAGWSGLHVDQSWGHGVMPLTFEALKSQRYRWCFGGIQILRKNWRSLLPLRRSDDRLSPAQRWGYFAGGLQWYGDLLGFVFYLFLLAGAVNLTTGGGQLFRKLTGFLLAAVPVLIVLGLVRAVALLRRGTGASWRDAIGAFFIWQATSIVVARASVQGLFAREAVFLRTPKTFDRAGWWQVVRSNSAETVLGVLGLAGVAGSALHVSTPSGPLLAALLVIPTLGYLAAPYNSFAAQRAALPPELSRRRRTEFLRQGAVRGAVAGGTVAILATAAVIVALLTVPSHGRVATPQLSGPRHSHSSHAPKRSTTPTSPHPSSSGSSTGPASGSSSAPSSSAPPSSSSTPAPSTSPAPSSSTR